MKLAAAGVLSVFRERGDRANGLLIDREGRLVPPSRTERASLPVGD
jgi:hypothetical protein